MSVIFGSPNNVAEGSLDATLLTLAERRGYSVAMSLTGDASGMWLECRDEASTPSGFIPVVGEAFEPIEMFTFGFPGATRPILVPAFLGPSTDTNESIPDSIWFDHFPYDEFFSLDDYNTVVQGYVKDGYVSSERLAHLLAERDGLITLLQRVAQQVLEVATGASYTLKVWLIEAHSADTTEEVSARVRRQVRHSWRQLLRGRHLRSDSIPTHGLSPALIATQREGLKHYERERDRIVEPARLVRGRHYALEYLALRALLREPVPSYQVAHEQAVEHLEGPLLDGRVKAKHLSDKMVRMYWECIERDGMKPPDARSHVLVKFSNPCSDRQLMRYILKAPKPDISDVSDTSSGPDMS